MLSVFFEIFFHTKKSSTSQHLYLACSTLHSSWLLLVHCFNTCTLNTSIGHTILNDLPSAGTRTSCGMSSMWSLIISFIFWVFCVCCIAVHPGMCRLCMRSMLTPPLLLQHVSHVRSSVFIDMF